jgi:predicted alpha-1,6-mannanase (GH76 family)
MGKVDASNDAPGESEAMDSAARNERDASTMNTSIATDARAEDARPMPTIPGCDAATAHARADLALADLMKGFWNDGARYFDATEPTDGRLTCYWTFAQAFDAMLDGVERGRYPTSIVQTLYAAQNARTWRSDYYDDENWMALALLRAFDLTGDRAYLDKATALYLEITAAWDDASAHPGGIWWDRAHTQKATASNAGPVITGVRLAARTGNTAHLAFARKVYEFWYTTMVETTTSKVADHILPDGTIVRGLLTYNEGLMVGAGLALHGATSEARFRSEAHAIAQALVRNETKATPAGRVLHDGTNTSCRGDCPQWKGIGYRWLAAALRDDPTRVEYRAVLQASVEAAWTLARNPTTGFFANDWAGPTMPTAAIEAESSTVIALNIYAMLCGD